MEAASQRGHFCSDPGDLGWHIDLSFPAETPIVVVATSASTLRRAGAPSCCFCSPKGRRSDPHPRRLPFRHTSFAGTRWGRRRAAATVVRNGAERRIALTTGEAGTVYLGHPFLIHVVQTRRGRKPRFMSQPLLAPATPLRLQPTTEPILRLRQPSRLRCPTNS